MRLAELYFIRAEALLEVEHSLTKFLPFCRIWSTRRCIG